MPKSYRGIILATFGWLILGSANHPDLKSQSEQAEAQRAVANHLAELAKAYQAERREAAEAPKETSPCGPHQYGGNADLCAQWKAADAAADSAWWAWAGGLIGIGSWCSVLAALGLAFWSNWIARVTARRQLRAYIGIDSCSVAGVKPSDAENANTKIGVKIRNFGQTPAKVVDCDFFVNLSGNGISEDRIGGKEWLPSGKTINPNQSMTVEIRVFIPSDIVELIHVGLYELVVTTRVVAKDGFGHLPELNSTPISTGALFESGAFSERNAEEK